MDEGGVAVDPLRARLESLGQTIDAQRASRGQPNGATHRQQLATGSKPHAAHMGTSDMPARPDRARATQQLGWDVRPDDSGDFSVGTKGTAPARRWSDRLQAQGASRAGAGQTHPPPQPRTDQHTGQLQPLPDRPGTISGGAAQHGLPTERAGTAVVVARPTPLHARWHASQTSQGDLECVSSAGAQGNGNTQNAAAIRALALVTRQE